MLLFWSRSGKLTRSKIFFPLNGRDASLLFWPALLYSSSPFTWKSYSKSNSFSPLYSLGQNYSKSNSSSLFSSDRIFLNQNSLFALSSWTEILSPTPSLQKHSKSNILSDLEKIPTFWLYIPYSCRWSLNNVHKR